MADCHPWHREKTTMSRYIDISASWIENPLYPTQYITKKLQILLTIDVKILIITIISLQKYNPHDEETTVR